MTTHPVHDERVALCDLFLEVGPDAPTRCGEWTTRDLAAHLWARERRPDSTPGLVVSGPLADHTERVRTKVLRRDYEHVVERLWSGPPVWWPGRWVPAMDVHEWFVHHEDVRRAMGKGPRHLGAFDDLVWSAVARFAKPLLGGLDVGVRAETPDGRARDLKDGPPVVTIQGDPGEVLLTMFGRDAEVELTGDADAVATFEAASLGL